MGRYNNKRTQAAAAALKNTPSRARFSKGPPNKGGRPKRNNGNDNNNSNNNSNNNNNTRDHRRSNTAATERVIDKIQNRVEQQTHQQQQHATTTRVASAEESLRYLDKSKLDHLKLAPDVLQNITTLLENLGIKETSNVKSANKELGKLQEPISNVDEEEGNGINMDTMEGESSYDDDDDGDGDSTFITRDLNVAKNLNQGRIGGGNFGYNEYDDDAAENDLGDEYEHIPRGPSSDGDWEGSTAEGSDGSDVSEADEQEDANDMEAFQENPVFLHLVQRLSFAQHEALRACQGIQDWQAVTQAAEDDDSANNKGHGTGQDTQESIALALDWLCLHLTDTELTRGLRPNPNPPATTSGPSKSGSVSLIGSIKAIPHHSISLAKDVTNDKMWGRSLRIQERVLKFVVRLGFHHAEATLACEQTASEDESIDLALAKSPPEEDPALFRLLSTICNNNHCKELDLPLESTQTIDESYLENAAEERQEEIEALQAIYDDQIQIIPATSETGGMDKCIVQITPVEELQPPARSQDCKLHIFFRPGYPVSETPLFLFTNPSLPPTLLRRINEECAKNALLHLGTAAIFQVVSHLSEILPDLHLSFIREQRRKEFEAQQLRLRKQAGHSLENAIDQQYDADGKLGRRQKARLKAAEKAYSRDDVRQQQAEEYRQKQQIRIQRVQEENANARAFHAEHAIRKREKELIEQEVEKAARSAMNAAFNRGENVDEARRAADKARAECLSEYGLDSIDEDNNNIAEDEKEDGSGDLNTRVDNGSRQTNPTKKTADFMERMRANLSQEQEIDGGTPDEDTAQETPPTAVEASQTTMAFMERLRQMYDGAAKKKAGFHLAEPKSESGTKGSTDKVPCPVAVPTGELGEVMEQVVKQQKEQPWLVSPEARVPAVEDQEFCESLTPEQVKKQRDINKRLREDLLLKREMARAWAEKREENEDNGMAKSGRKFVGFRAEKYYNMLSVRSRLPAFGMAREVVDTIESNQITVIAGDTGCGKTTQVPQLVLDDRILKEQGAVTNIIVTQPRRISAIGVAERIADERCEKVGDTCGYSIKLEKKMSSKTRLLLCTTGVLLRRLQCDPDLASVSHIFVDEVHERDLNTDFLIIILKDLLARRRNLKLVLMSATLNSEAFSTYFSRCPVVSIPGRTHPVKENRLEDILELTGYRVLEHSDYAIKADDSKPPKISKSRLRQLYYPKYSKETIHSLSLVNEEVINYELIAALLEYITLHQEEGAILVFMPGMMEITKTIEEMYKKELFQSDKVRIYPLHSSLSTAEQIAIFEVPPQGVRKIVISTNIAETSITIEDVVFVVDSGRVKENRRDEINETPTLVECWVSRASAKQRRGRAGRVRPGIAYHLYSSHTHDNDLSDYQLPEMLRVGIEDLVLQVLVLDLGEPATFLGKALNPPSELAMSNSLKLLETLGAVECQWSQTPPGKKSNEASDQACGTLKVSSQLTALGFHLAALPVDSRVGKLMIYGSLFGCVDPALTIAASMSSRSPFVSPFDQREAADMARKSFAIEGSDHLTILNAFTEWQALKQSKRPNREMTAFLKENFLGRLTLHQMEDLRSQYSKLLKDIGFLPSNFQLKTGGEATIANANSKNMGLVKAVLCAGLYPNILVAPRNLLAEPGRAAKKSDKKVGECAFQSHRKGEVYLHPSTIAFDQSSLDSRYCCYHEIVKTSKTYARDTTTVSPFALLLFGGTLSVHQTHGVCIVDEWLKFRLDAKPATLVKYLRGQMEKILFKKILNPNDDIVESVEGRALVESISILFASKDSMPIPLPDRSGGEIVRPWTGNDEGEHNAAPNGNGGRTSGGRRGGGRGGRGRGGRGRNGRGRSGRGSGRG